MTEDVQKKGMSKGCMVALIVVGVLFIMAVVAGVTCWMKKEALVKYGVKTAVQQIGNKAIENPQDGVDTAVVNAYISAFIEKFDADSTLDMEALGLTMQKLQYIPQDDKVDSAEAVELMKALSEIYPELNSLIMPAKQEMETDTSLIEDTTLSE